MAPTAAALVTVAGHLPASGLELYGLLCHRSIGELISAVTWPLAILLSTLVSLQLGLRSEISCKHTQLPTVLALPNIW